MKYNQPYGVTDPDGNAGYVNGNPSTGTMGSIPPAASIEYPQREIVGVIQYAFDRGLIDFNNQACAAPNDADLQQLLKAIFGLTNQQKLQADTTIYINASTGDDALADGTAAKPYRSYQAAVNAAQARFDLNQKHTITFHGTGTFATTGHNCYLAGLFAGQSGASSVIFDNTNATFNTSLGACFYINQGAQVTIIGGNYSATWNGLSTGYNQGVAFEIGTGAIVMHRGGTFNACDMEHFYISGALEIIGSYNIAGNSKFHAVVTPQALYACTNGPFTINCVGTPNFSNVMFSCYGGSVDMSASGVSFTGTATGKRYNLSGFGTIYTAGGGPNFIPGNAAGTIAASTGNGEYT